MSDLDAQDELAVLQAEVQVLRQQQAEMAHRLMRLEENQQKSWSFKKTPQTPLASPQTPSHPAEPTAQVLNLERLLGLQGFSWLGILALITGLGLFVRYAYLEGWLGPWATLLAGLVLGVGLILGGEVLSRKALYRVWAHALMGGGVALIYFLVYAAYHFQYFRRVTGLSQRMDMLLLMAVVILAIVLALRRRSQSLASRAFVLGFVTSLLGHDFLLMALFYNIFLTLGLIVVTAVPRWHALALMGALGSWLLHGVWALNNEAASLWIQGVSLLYLGLYALLDEHLGASRPAWVGQSLAPLNIVAYVSLSFFAIEHLSAMQALLFHLAALILVLALVAWAVHKERLRSMVHGAYVTLTVLAVNGILLEEFDELLGLVLFCVVPILLGMAFWLRRKRVPHLPAVLDTLAVVCAIEVVFDWVAEPWAVPVLALLAALVLWGYRQGIDYWHRLSWSLSLTACLAALAILEPGAYGGAAPVPLSELLAVAFTILLIFASVYLCTPPEKWQQAFLWPTTGVGMALFHAWLPESWLSIAWALSGSVLIGAGFALRQRVWRYLGMGVLLCTGLKVYFYDMAELNLGFRILSLVVLGVLLLGVALLYTRLQPAESSGESSGETGASDE